MPPSNNNNNNDSEDESSNNNSSKRVSRVESLRNFLLYGSTNGSRLPQHQQQQQQHLVYPPQAAAPGLHPGVPLAPLQLFEFAPQLGHAQCSCKPHRRSKSTERINLIPANSFIIPGVFAAAPGCPPGHAPLDGMIRFRRRNSSLENLNEMLANDGLSDKPKEDRIVKFKVSVVKF